MSMFLAPSGVPQSLEVSSNTNTTITISWKRVECHDRNSNIMGYMIRYQGSSETVLGTDDENRTFTANGLTPNTDYTFMVAAVNTDGQIGLFESVTTRTKTTGI